MTQSQFPPLSLFIPLEWSLSWGLQRGNIRYSIGALEENIRDSLMVYFYLQKE